MMQELAAFFFKPSGIGCRLAFEVLLPAFFCRKIRGFFVSPICSGPGLTATIAGALTGSPLSSHRLQCSGGVPRAVAVAGWMT